MTVPTDHSTHLLKRLGALAVMGVGATLVGLGASGTATADTFDLLPVPAPPAYSEEGPTTVAGDYWMPTPPLPDSPFAAGPRAGARLGEDVGLNPQPLPPGPDRGRRVSLNPQPLPPGPDWRLPFLRLPGF